MLATIWTLPSAGTGAGTARPMPRTSSAAASSEAASCEMPSVTAP